MRFFRIHVAAALALGALGCDSAFSTDDVYTENLTISNGVAGVFASAVEGASEPVEGASVDVFDAAAFVDGALTGEPRSTSTTNSDGFFELQLDDADYIITRPESRASFASISVTGGVIRCDHASSGQGASWDCR